MRTVLLGAAVVLATVALLAGVVGYETARRERCRTWAEVDLGAVHWTYDGQCHALIQADQYDEEWDYDRWYDTPPERRL